MLFTEENNMIRGSNLKFESQIRQSAWHDKQLVFFSKIHIGQSSKSPLKNPKLTAKKAFHRFNKVISFHHTLLFDLILFLSQSINQKYTAQGNEIKK